MRGIPDIRARISEERYAEYREGIENAAGAAFTCEALVRNSSQNPYAKRMYEVALNDARFYLMVLKRDFKDVATYGEILKDVFKREVELWKQ